MASPSLLNFLIVFSFLTTTSFTSTFVINNNCPFTIWPATLSGSGMPPLPTTGFQLDSGQSIAIPCGPGWSGRLWARTGCTFDATGVGSCQTGDCGGKLECDGMGATPPASLFEITLGIGDQKDFYDVSVVDGYNLPMVAAPRGVHGGCNVTGAVVGSLLTRQRAGHLSIQESSREPVQELIAMHLMMEQALSHARPQNTS